MRGKVLPVMELLYATESLLMSESIAPRVACGEKARVVKLVQGGELVKSR
jgi:hypothetical protein